MLIEIITVEQFKVLLDYDIAEKIANDRLARLETLNNRVSMLAVLYTELCRRLYVECEDAREIVEATENPQATAYVEYVSHYDASNVVYDLMQEATKEANTEASYLAWFKTTTFDPAYKAAIELIKGKRDEGTKGETVQDITLNEDITDAAEDITDAAEEALIEEVKGLDADDLLDACEHVLGLNHPATKALRFEVERINGEHETPGSL